MKSIEKIAVERFDAYLKKVFANDVKSYYISLSKKREQYVTFSNMTVSEKNKLQHNDVYKSELFSKKVSTKFYDVILHDELLYDAILSLNPKRREIILLKYWGEKTDSEIGELIGMSQRTVNYNKNKSLKILKETITIKDVKKSDKRT